MAVNVTPERVLQVLHEAGVRPVLMGMYGMVGWRSEPRATLDVDVLVRKRDIRKAVRSLAAAFPNLTVKDTPVVTRFEDPEIGKAVIDVMKPSQEVYHMVFRHTISAGAMHDIPNLEMSLVAKFAALTSPHRVRAKKIIDWGDFTDMVVQNRKAIRIAYLRRLSDRVYPDGGMEIQRLIDDIDNDRPIQI